MRHTLHKVFIVHPFKIPNCSNVVSTAACGWCMTIAVLVVESTLHFDTMSIATVAVLLLFFTAYCLQSALTTSSCLTTQSSKTDKSNLLLYITPRGLCRKRGSAWASLKEIIYIYIYTEIYNTKTPLRRVFFFYLHETMDHEDSRILDA